MVELKLVELVRMGGLLVMLDTADAKSFSSFSSESWERMLERLFVGGRVDDGAAEVVPVLSSVLESASALD